MSKSKESRTWVDDESSWDEPAEGWRAHRTTWTAWLVPHRTLTFFYFLMNCFYLLSLKGTRTPKAMSRLLATLGAYIVISVIAGTIVLWAAFWQPPRIRRLLLTVLPVTLTVWYIYDNGNLLESHGAVNLLIYCLIATGVNLVLLVLYHWYKFAVYSKGGCIKRFIYQAIAVTVAMTMTIIFLTRRNSEKANFGFFGIRIEDADQENMCTWKSSTAWFDLLPVRQNIFTGPMTCSKDLSFSAKFQGNMLHIEGCSAEETEIKAYRNDSVLARYPGAAYSLLPITSDWGYPLKKDDLSTPVSQFQMHILDYIDAHGYAYTGPAKIPADTDTVLAWCGSAEPKLVYRIPKLRETGTQKKTKDRQSLNVVTLFFDSVNRSVFHKRLPKTVKTLESFTHFPGERSEKSVSLTEFFRYHVVGMNTPPNTRALWAGQSEYNISDDRPLMEGKPMWEQYHEAGYVAGRIDSNCEDWDAYYNPSHSKPQMSVTPTLDHEFISFACIRPYLPLTKSGAGNFAGPSSIRPRCYSDQQQSSHVLDISEAFIEQYTKRAPRPFYLHAGFMDGHEGSGELLAAADERLSSFLDPKTSPIDYNNTAVIILADHGLLLGLNYAFTLNGHVLQANPFAAIMLPDWFTEVEADGTSAREKLADASQKMITAHDLYETTRNLKAGDNVKDLNVVDAQGARRGFDLLRHSVPHRSCLEAGVRTVDCYCN